MAILGTLAALILTTSPAAPAHGAAVDTSAAAWRTTAERSSYRVTPDYDETIGYCRRIAAASPWVRVTSYGESGQGRALPLVILSKDRAFTPEAARATGKPIVLIQNGIHSGEIEGKDASLELMRDIAVNRKRARLLDHAILLVLPIFSVDAHERRSRYNRINQNGPEEMGWRATPVGLNLNRDYVKVETPEMRALISRVFTRWWPDLLLDNHTTDGADYRHDLTYGINHGPGVPAGVDHWLTSAFEGRVIPRLQVMGHLTAPYLAFRKGNDPLTGLDLDNSKPRFSTGYGPLQCRPAILLETHMLKSYESRVRVTYDLMQALLEEINARPDSLRRAVADAEREVIERGRARGANRPELTLTTKVTERSTPFTFHGVVTRWETSPITGGRVPHYSTTPWDTVISFYRDLAPDVVTRQPLGYLVPREWTIARDRLEVHGVRFRRFAKAWSDTVEAQHVMAWKVGKDQFEGHRPTEVTSVALERRWRTFRPGDLWVPLDQRSALIAIELFEAQAPDGLMYWNAFDTVLLKKEYGEAYVVEPMARKMLEADTALAREFQTRLASDTTFARDSTARNDFFYRRTPWADPDQDIHPVLRALHAPPESVLEPVAASSGSPAKR